MKRRTFELIQHLSVSEASYIAGFTDGEGWIGLSRRKKTWANGQGTYLRPIVSLTQKDRRPLDWISSLVGNAGHIHVDGRFGQIHELKFDGPAIRWLLPQLIPFLIVKKKQAELVLRFCNLCRYMGKRLTHEQLAEREGVRAELEALNAKPSNRILSNSLSVVQIAGEEKAA